MTNCPLENKPVRSSWRGIMILILFAAVLRGGVVAAQYRQLAADPDAYRLIAKNLATRGVFSRTRLDAPVRPTAFRPPLYPLLLTACGPDGRIPPATVAILHAILGVATVMLTFMVAGLWRLELGRWVAALGVACDPILLHQSTQVMTETLATLLAVATLWVITRWDPRQSWRAALATGIILGITALCRPTFLVWAALIVIFIAWHGRRGSWRGASRAAVVALAMAIPFAPWIARNWHALQKPVIATTHGGYTLLLGNNPFFYHYLRTQRFGTVWDARELQAWLEQQPEFARAERAGGPAEIDADHYLYRLALQSIRQDPVMFAYASLIRLGRLWAPLPHQLDPSESVGHRLVRYGIATWYLVLYMAVLVMFLRRWKTFVRWPWLLGLLLILAFSGVHMVYWSNMRMRAPLMPVLYLIAATWTGRKKFGFVPELEGELGAA